MVVRDPALVVVLGSTGSGSDGLRGRLGLNDVDVLLGLLCGAGTLGLGEQGLNPGLVDKVESSSKGSRQEEVEEDAKGQIV